MIIDGVSSHMEKERASEEDGIEPSASHMFHRYARYFKALTRGKGIKIKKASVNSTVKGEMHNARQSLNPPILVTFWQENHV